MKLLVTILAILIYSIPTKGQDTTYFDNKGNKTFSWDSTFEYRVVIKEKDDNGRITIDNYYKSGQPISSIQQKNRELDGSLMTYWDNGNLKRSDVYKNNKFVKGKCFDENGKQINHFDFEISPQFPGGDLALHNYIYDQVNQWNAGTSEGTILVRFVIHKDGSITDINIIEGLNKELDEKAIELISKMPKWNPGQQDGNNVNVAFNLPIRVRSYGQ